MPLPNLGPDYDMSQRMAALERQVRQLAANQLAQAFSATQSDGSVGLSILQRRDNAGATAFTVYQGPNTPRDAQTGLHQALLYIGQLFVNGQPSSSGLILSRPDGSQIMTAGAGGFTFYDKAHNIVVASDEAAGWGLLAPWLPMPTPAAASTAGWPSTTSTSMAAIAFGDAVLQHAKIRWQASAYCPAGTSGQVQLFIDSQPVGQVWPVPGGTFASIDEVITLPSGYGWQSQAQLQVNAAVTGGTGSVACQVFGVYGRGT